MSQSFILKLKYWPVTIAVTLLLSFSTLSSRIAFAADDVNAQNNTTSTAASGSAANVTPPTIVPPTVAPVNDPVQPTTPAQSIVTVPDTTLPAGQTTLPISPEVPVSVPAPNPCAVETTPAALPVAQTSPTSPSPTSAVSPATAVATTTPQNLTINGNYCSNAASGSAAVTQNGTAGNAATGNASAAMTILNLLQSTTGINPASLSLPTINIDGNQTGDITLSLDKLTNSVCGLVCSGLQINNGGNAAINNTILLNATTGNADVTYNKEAGNATTGNATANLNLVNIINSLIASSKNFLGVVNINGSLNGDILLQGANLSNLNKVSGQGQGTSLGGDNTLSIDNNVDIGATTGNANVKDNGEAGNATTGNAVTSINSSNLVGTHISGKNALLVFVNVMGKWQGMIVDNPGNANAVLGDGTSSCDCAQLADYKSGINAAINNAIKINAKSGNANVIGNDKAGNATTGNASAGLNMLNIANSDINVSDWFGILFINVFGSWDGSFGIDTTAGDLPSMPTDVKVTISGVINQPPKHKKTTTAFNLQSTTVDPGQSPKITKVLGSVHQPPKSGHPQGSKINLKLGAIGGLSCFLILGALERRGKHGQKNLLPQTA